MSRIQMILKTLLVTGVVGSAAAAGSYSAFTTQAGNDDNRVSVGTAVLADNDGGTAPLYDITAGRPGSTQTSCIRVSYAGSLAATVRMYTPSTIGALGPEVNLKVEAGTQASPSYPSCTGFVADTTLFDAALSTFPTSYTGGVTDFPGSGSAWTSGDAVVYRVTATLSASAGDSAQGATTGLHALRWEAQNR